MTAVRTIATLEQVRFAEFSLCQFPSGTLAASPLAVASRPGTRDPFGDSPEGFLLARSRITEEQWLAALADHWSSWSSPARRSIGATIVAHGYLAQATVEAEARVFHDELDVVEVDPAGAPRPARSR